MRTPSPAVTHPAAAPAHGIPVLPAVDANLGAVTFATPAGWRHCWTDQPAALLDALAQAVRPAHWFPEIHTLVVTVAGTGHRQGRGLGFVLLAV
ncbi:hypothetical protein [Specibacter cremeus]|uniref:hypothetical protein n=1 Tax=Specibacter cremeus TaxID=1629051 RepID=UPI000F7AAF1D|nr:hypothetical protein [Specibacter cremeus]